MRALLFWPRPLGIAFTVFLLAVMAAARAGATAWNLYFLLVPAFAQLAAPNCVMLSPALLISTAAMLEAYLLAATARCTPAIKAAWACVGFALNATRGWVYL